MIRQRKWIGAGILAVLSTTAAGTALAQQAYPYYGPSLSGFYLGASAGEAFYNEDGIPQLTPSILMFRVGQQFSPYLAIEGRIGTGISGSSSYGNHVNLDALYAGYVKGMLPVTPWFYPYAIAGLGGADIHRNYPDFHSSDGGFSFGGGLEFNLGGGASVNVEWARLINNGDNIGYNFTTDQLTVGLNWHPYFF